ncbi:hypothetical protein DFR70_12679 [Nocardia tenerifensis]|uniref:Uncharacterized protein n=1 Tax=Nocardia tenerifensis TaxID=228006 RepID=A0A318JP17_9NOCA|nr:hypothetical protein [Nocardia tenerifensis]PXX53958.1 hypothetical protein DFR70_12679 [Nocardia tenerifensis]
MRPWPRVKDKGVRSFLTLPQVAEVTGQPYTKLLRLWKTGGRMPSPDIMVGRRGGWSLPCAQYWKQLEFGLFPRPACLHTVTIGTIAAQYEVQWWQVWNRIEVGVIDEPAVWLDGQPGWLPRVRTSSTTGEAAESETSP